MPSSPGVRGIGFLVAMCVSVPAHAQVNYYTQGFFTSGAATCNAAAPLIGAPVSASCSGAGFTLDYTAVPTNPGPIASGSVISLGQFLLTGTGSVTVAPPQVGFTLFVRQTAPAAGSGTFTGYISGTVTTNGPAGDFSSLMWTPNEFVNISPATYQMIFDNVGYAAGVGLAIPINQARGINALVTTSTVPEPSSVLLSAAGLLGIGMMVRFSRGKHARTA